MKHVTPFVISEFTNPSGDVVYRVSGWLDGQRVRKNFSTRAEAEAERQALKLAQIQAETGVRTAATRLTDDQLKEAEGAFLRLEGRTRSLSFYLDYALTNYRDPVNDKPLAEAARVEVLPDRLLLYTEDGDSALRDVHERGLTPESALVRRATLEDVFVSLTGRHLRD